MKLKLLLFLMLLLPMSSMAQKVAYAVLKDSTLTFYYGKNKPEGAYDVEKRTVFSLTEWYDVCDQIHTVVFDQSFKEYRPKSCERWFSGCKNLISIKNIKENLNTSEVTNMREMFWGCKKLISLDVSGFNTDKVIDMSRMFERCEKLTSLDVKGFNTEKVTDMSFLFLGCEKLTSLDVSSFNTDNVTNMYGMFYACHNLTSLKVSGFNTNKVTSMGAMFWGCESLTSLDVSGFNTENVTYMSEMFAYCYSLTSLDVSRFHTDNVTDMNRMFVRCDNLKTIYVGDGWNTSSVKKSEFMFLNCPNLIGEQGTKYHYSHHDASYAHIDGGESNPGYFTKT